METHKRKALEAAGYHFTDAATFVGMTEVERAVLQARLALATALRRERQAQHLTQKQLAERIGSSQPRVVRLEQAAADVSFDLLLKALAAVGVRFSVRDHGADRGAAAEKPSVSRKPKGHRPAKIGREKVRVEIELIEDEL
jgi:transcriptional regulator with XRE-family HTH domain